MRPLLLLALLCSPCSAAWISVVPPTDPPNGLDPATWLRVTLHYFDDSYRPIFDQIHASYGQDQYVRIPGNEFWLSTGLIYQHTTRVLGLNVGYEYAPLNYDAYIAAPVLDIGIGEVRPASPGPGYERRFVLNGDTVWAFTRDLPEPNGLAIALLAALVLHALCAAGWKIKGPPR